MKRNVFLMAVLSAFLVTPAVAQDDAKKKRQNNRGQNRVATQFLKQLEKVELTEEQTAKVKELGKEANEQMAAIRKEAGITPELQKKRVEVAKEMADSEKKGKERIAAINKEAGFTEDQAAAWAKINQVRTDFQRKVFATLTDEQKTNLPEKFQRALKASERQAKQKKRNKS